jgi:excisionase family DNA binding protein
VRTRPRQKTSQASQRGRLLTLAQAGERVQLSPWTLRRAIERGELVGLRFGRRIRVSEQALEAWIADRLIEPSVPSKGLTLAGTNGAASKRRSKLAPNYFRQAAKEGISP